MGTESTLKGSKVIETYLQTLH